MRRIVVLGTSGSGKSTVSQALADVCRVPHVDLDELSSDADDMFIQRVREVVSQPEWIIDGDFQRRLGDLVLARAELAVWLDLPLRVSLARMWTRTIARIDSRALPANLALLRWVGHEIRSHIRRRFLMSRRLAAHPDLRVVRLRRQQDVDAWLATSAREAGVLAGCVARPPLGPAASVRRRG